MKRFVSLAVAATIAVLGGAAVGAPERDAFTAGHAAAAAGDHKAAAEQLERSIRTDGWSAGALLGLGNAYASAGDPARAILAYERGRIIAPRDAALVTNLARVRESAGLTAPPSSRIDATAQKLTANEWTQIALGAMALACLGILGLAWRIRRGFARAFAIVGVAIATIASVAAARVSPPRERAIALTAETARIAPFAEAEAAFDLAPGARVDIEQERAPYVYVRDGERAGWIRGQSIERLLP
jgi:tetratricopeptide (TPR) repeat protein